jgi:3-methyladenine DNA glycosylase AlkD
VDAALAWLERNGSRRYREGLTRYAITAPKVFGVPVGALRKYAKTLGRDHDLSAALWETGWYEARMLAVFVGDPARVTPAQMDRWAGDFDNWAICDTACFDLFDKTPHAYDKVVTWARRRDEFVKRAAFALIAGLAQHDKKAPDSRFRPLLPLIARAATDERNFVKKGVSWALRGIGHRSPALRAEAVRTAERLAASDDRTARWVGKDAIRDLKRAEAARA